MLVSGQSSRAAGGQSDRPGPRAALPRGGQDRSKPNQAQGNHCRVLQYESLQQNRKTTNSPMIIKMVD